MGMALLRWRRAQHVRRWQPGRLCDGGRAAGRPGPARIPQPAWVAQLLAHMHGVFGSARDPGQHAVEALPSLVLWVSHITWRGWAPAGCVQASARKLGAGTERCRRCTPSCPAMLSDANSVRQRAATRVLGGRRQLSSCLARPPCRTSRCTSRWRVCSRWAWPPAPGARSASWCAPTCGVLITRQQAGGITAAEPQVRKKLRCASSIATEHDVHLHNKKAFQADVVSRGQQNKLA